MGWRCRWHLSSSSSSIRILGLIIILSAATFFPVLVHSLQQANNETTTSSELVPLQAAEEAAARATVPSPVYISQRIKCPVKKSYSDSVKACGQMCGSIMPKAIKKAASASKAYKEGCCLGKNSNSAAGYCYCCLKGKCTAKDPVAGCEPKFSADCQMLTYAAYGCAADLPKMNPDDEDHHHHHHPDDENF